MSAKGTHDGKRPFATIYSTNDSFDCVMGSGELLLRHQQVYIGDPACKWPGEQGSSRVLKNSIGICFTFGWVALGYISWKDTLSVLGKFDRKSDEGFLVGYSLNSKAYRVYNLVTKRVEVNLHVNFLEDKPNVKGVASAETNQESCYSQSYSKAAKKTITRSTALSVACFLISGGTKKFAEAFTCDSWVQAMQEELLQFKLQQDKYVAEILKKFDLVNVKAAITPMETKMSLTKDEESFDVDVHLYKIPDSVKNPVYHSKTKHIEIRHHFIRDCYEKKLISVEKIHTDLNVADLLTKPFDGPRFNYLVVSIVGFLRKPDESAGFAEIVDFLRGSNLRYALTTNPTIYDSLVKQFRQTVTANTKADGSLEIKATIDTIGYTFTEASIRDSLQLEDAIMDYYGCQMMKF
ncbi:putative ribonuclease H-like domain-containing protein [Tanacetum coccineum]